MVPYTGPHTTPLSLGLANILARCPPSILVSKLGHQSPDGWLCKAAEDWLDSWALRRLGDGPELPGGRLQGVYKGKDPSAVIPGTCPNSPSDGPRRGQNAPSSLQMTPNVSRVEGRAVTEQGQHGLVERARGDLLQSRRDKRPEGRTDCPLAPCRLGMDWLGSSSAAKALGCHRAASEPGGAVHAGSKDTKADRAVWPVDGG